MKETFNKKSKKAGSVINNLAYPEQSNIERIVLFVQDTFANIAIISSGTNWLALRRHTTKQQLPVEI
jgi:hypothetical protein